MVTWRARLAIIGALSAAACSSYNRATGGGDSGASAELPPIGVDVPARADAPIGVDVPAPLDLPPTDAAPEGYSCHRLCRRLSAIRGCEGADNTCLNNCAMELSRFPTACTRLYDRLFQCIEAVAENEIMCTGGYPFVNCAMANRDAITCVQANP